jgi:putative membrane protein
VGDAARRDALRALAFVLIAAASPAAWAHESPPAALDASLGVAIGIAMLIYLRGARNLWHAAPGHRRAVVRHTAPFALGWFLLATALLPPFAAISAETFSGHMLQHEVLMIAAAPLLVLGRPFAVWLWAFPVEWRASIAAPTRGRTLRAIWDFLSAPLTATLVHGVAIWAWHAPPLFSGAQHDVWMHALQHSAFFFTALLFWNAVLGARAGATTTGASLVWLFVTMLHTSALGVLLTFSAGLWYPEASGASAWGLSGLEDQQLGGLIMWVPGGTVYVIAALSLAARWLNGVR